MNRFALLVLIVPLSGCFTVANGAYLNTLSNERTRQVDVPVHTAVALRTSEGVIEVGVTYNDGVRTGVRLDLAKGKSQAIDMPWPPSEGLGLPIRGEPDAEGLSICDEILRWREAGRAPIVVNLERSKSVVVPRTVGGNAGRFLKGTLAALALPLSVGVDAVTWPLQLLAFGIYRAAGGSLLIFG